MNTSVRKAKKVDRKACINLLQQLYSHLSSEDLEEKFFWGDEQAYVLSADGKLVGIAIWEEYDYLPDGSCLLELAAIVIDKDHRRQEFGMKLYKDSLAIVGRTLDIAGIHVLATGDSEGFYEKVMTSSQRVKTPELLIGGIWYVSFLCKI